MTKHRNIRSLQQALVKTNRTRLPWCKWRADLKSILKIIKKFKSKIIKKLINSESKAKVLAHQKRNKVRLNLCWETFRVTNLVRVFKRVFNIVMTYLNKLHHCNILKANSTQFKKKLMFVVGATKSNVSKCIADVSNKTSIALTAIAMTVETEKETNSVKSLLKSTAWETHLLSNRR